MSLCLAHLLVSSSPFTNIIPIISVGPTCQCHFNLLSCTSLDISPTFVAPVTLSLLILSNCVTPLIYATVILFATSSFFPSAFFMTCIMFRPRRPTTLVYIEYIIMNETLLSGIVCLLKTIACFKPKCNQGINAYVYSDAIKWL